ncbi:hypothetical protein F3Y22_tig00110474pilonHSYRG00229 [Hibiscus syriacus]|uniref:DUF1279 domain-containing protein n=1 Tax=Hibiscus syriacus TaxID=106335 RepID=A0A6A3AEX7_HIBSY|nr:uncharacterized protein LOC120128078 [Hibiscus syriacus]KAE8703161.1 hypothetical protein F3Y22_tig00110474pilonHSYRG00229 [Hibiscus syriacus]
MAAAFSGSRFKEFVKKYGKVALGVHFSVSAASITGLYVAIKNNVDVESLFDKLHLPDFSNDQKNQNPSPQSDGFLMEEPMEESRVVAVEEKQRNRTAELAASTGGALALAVICNKALFPVRVPITVALTPPIARFLARRRIIKI